MLSKSSFIEELRSRQALNAEVRLQRESGREYFMRERHEPSNGWPFAGVIFLFGFVFQKSSEG